MKELRAIGAILALLALFAIVFRRSGEKAAPPALPDPPTVGLENDRQLDSLKAFIDSMGKAPPDTVRVAAGRYIRKHDTLWRQDTLRDTVERLTEVTRWLMLSDSTQRQKLDSVTRMDSLHLDQRDSAEAKRTRTSDSVRVEKERFHWDDAAMGATGTLLLLSGSAAAIFFSH